MARIAEYMQVSSGFAGQLLGAASALRNAQETRIGQLTAGRVLPHALSGLFGGTFHVEQVVGDLEQLTETSAVSVEAFQGRTIRTTGTLALGRPDSQAQAGPETARRSCKRGCVPAFPASPVVSPKPSRPPARRPCRRPPRRGPALGSKRPPLPADNLRPIPEKRASTRRRPPGSPAPRRISCDRSAGPGEGRRHPSPAGRRG